MSRIEKALAHISPNLPRDEWVAILMAIKSEIGENGRLISEEWSEKGEGYSPSGFAATWKSINAGGGITIATLYDKAKENGFTFGDNDTPEIIEPAHQEVNEQQELEKRIQSIANYWKTLQTRHPPQPCLNHPYLERKEINHHGVCYLPNYTDKHTRTHGKDPLLLWAMSGKKLTGFQMIYSDGFKAFVAGTIKKGSYYLVTKDKDPKTADKVVLCEGFATCCSVIEHRHKNAMGYIAFDAGNMPIVASHLRRLYPNKEIYICADNDYKTELKTGRNAGTYYGKQAARLINGHFERPVFKGELAEQYSDWNDYYNLKKQIEAGNGKR